MQMTRSGSGPRAGILGYLGLLAVLVALGAGVSAQTPTESPSAEGGQELTPPGEETPRPEEPAGPDLSRPSPLRITCLGDLQHPRKAKNHLVEIITRRFHDNSGSSVVTPASWDVIDRCDASSDSALQPGCVQGNGVQYPQAWIERKDHVVDITVTLPARVRVNVHKTG